MTYAPHVIGSIVKFSLFSFFFCCPVYDDVMLKLYETSRAELYVKFIEAQFDVTSHARKQKSVINYLVIQFGVLCMMKHFCDQNLSNMVTGAKVFSPEKK